MVRFDPHNPSMNTPRHPPDVLLSPVTPTIHSITFMIENMVDKIWSVLITLSTTSDQKSDILTISWLFCLVSLITKDFYILLFSATGSPTATLLRLHLGY